GSLGFIKFMQLWYWSRDGADSTKTSEHASGFPHRQLPRPLEASPRSFTHRCCLNSSLLANHTEATVGLGTAGASRRESSAEPSTAEPAASRAPSSAEPASAAPSAVAASA